MECPKCRRSEFKKWGIAHPLSILWILHPSIMLIELIAGLRLPKATYVCQSCKDPFVERTYLYCESCDTLTNGMVFWAKGRSFGYWYGYVCPKCQKIIPCLWNLTSLLVLGLTFPLWLIPAWKLREKWLSHKIRKVQQAVTVDDIKINYVGSMMLGAALMWSTDTTFDVIGFVQGELIAFSYTKTLLELIGWLVFGGLVGFLFKVFFERKPRPD